MMFTKVVFSIYRRKGEQVVSKNKREN